MASPAYSEAPWTLDGAQSLIIRAGVITIATVVGEVSDPTVRADGQLLAAAPQLLESLLAVEWAGNEDGTDGLDGYDCCPNCGAALGSRHTPTCELRDALDAALGVKTPRAEVSRG